VPRPPPFPAVASAIDVSVVPGTAAPPAPACPWPRNPAVSTCADPPAAAAAPVAELPSWLAALGRWPLLTKPFTPCAASEPVNVCALTERFGAESPPIVRRAPDE
jgi:hypothetical protein